MNWIYTLLFFLFHLGVMSQTLDSSRRTDWTYAGLRDTTTVGFVEIDMQAQGAVGDGITPNDAIIANVLSNTTGSGAILNFPSGDYLFNNTIDITDNIIIKGQGANNTSFLWI